MAITQVDLSDSSKAGAKLVEMFRGATREIYFPPCRNEAGKFLIRDRVFLVNSLGEVDGNLVFDDGKRKYINALPEEWTVMSDDNGGEFIVKNLGTNKFKVTNPNEGIVKVSDILDSDGDLRRAVLDRLASRDSEVKIAMKKALERIAGLVTAFTDDSTPWTIEQRTTHPREVVDDILSSYIDVLAGVANDMTEKEKLIDTLHGLKRRQLEFLLLYGVEKYDHMKLPILPALFAREVNKGKISSGDVILIPGSPQQFITIYSVNDKGIDLSLCSLAFGLDGAIQSVKVNESDLIRGVSVAKLLKTFLGVSPKTTNDESLSEMVKWENLETLRKFGHIGKYDFKVGLENYNQIQRAAFERGVLIQLSEAFKKAHTD